MYKYCENIGFWHEQCFLASQISRQNTFVNWIFAYIKVYAVVWRIDKKKLNNTGLLEIKKKILLLFWSQSQVVCFVTRQRLKNCPTTE